MRVLLVEDDLPLAQALKTALERHGLIVDTVHSIAIADAALRLGVHDVLLLDRSLPDGDGLGFIATARGIAQALPIIVLTARGELPDRVEGLNGGADDYVTKPVAIDELLARLRAVARRPAALALSEARIGRLSFDFSTQEARVGGGEPLRLQRRQLLILEALVYRQGRTVRREALREAVYGLDDEIQSNALDAHISKLRKLLEVAEAEVEIAVVRGVGYLLKEKRCV
ncbi:response regulator transcription factor [Mitsuaria sp. GD03876]|uniref:response regulator transcription factor n=1 Tax=Mitsuaria sp. GD03876 TaxID=2975399 RepID=UPI002448EB82|nr:response regulator transcription factor [Mitsuaria sp. GD03876]MDH0868328.1 response regulator transcription factor [Mitsuaria sp. GD03876]